MSVLVANRPLTETVHHPSLAYIIDVSWDDEAGVWIAVSDEIPIVLGNESLEVLIKRVQVAVPDMLEHEHGIKATVELLFREVALTDG